MDDTYQLKIVCEDPAEEVTRKGPLSYALEEEQRLIAEYTRQGFKIHKHLLGFTARSDKRQLDIDCEIRKIPQTYSPY